MITDNIFDMKIEHRQSAILHGIELVLSGMLKKLVRYNSRHFYFQYYDADKHDWIQFDEKVFGIIIPE